MKIVFAGTPDFAVQPLVEIVASGFSVVGGNVRFALLSVKGIGKQLIDEIIKEIQSWQI